MSRVRTGVAGVVASLVLASGLMVQAQADAWLSWPADHAESVGRAAYVKGRVGRFFDTRLLKTERSYNYKLAATWLTPDVVRATARLAQITRRLPEAATREMVSRAEAEAHTVVIVEIDPREGSGVIPDDWIAFLQFDDGEEIVGTSAPALREVPALAGVLRRNYDYDRFWVTFPLVSPDGKVLPERAARATLVVRIYDKEGRVTWPVPASVRERARLLASREATATR